MSSTTTDRATNGKTLYKGNGKSKSSIKSTNSNKKKKNSHSNNRSKDTSNTPNTVPGEENSTQPPNSNSIPSSKKITRKHSFFFNLKIDLQKHASPTTELRNKLVTFFTLIKQADSTAIVCLHNTTDCKDALLAPRDLPKSVGDLRLYFDRVFPVEKGGQTYPGVRLAMDGCRERLMQHTEYDLRAGGINMWYRSIQSKSVIKGYYLQNFVPDAELKFWAEFFQSRIQEKAKEEGYAANSQQANAKVSLKCHPLNDGFRRRDLSASTWSARRNLAVHVEFEESMAEFASGLLREILKGDEFASMYGATVRLCPVINNRLQTEETKERIRQCQARHRMTLYNLTTGVKLGIESFGLDTRCKKIGLTLRHMIMEQKGSEGQRLFISVARSVYGNEVLFSYPKLYEKEAHTRMAAIGQYLQQKYGNAILQFFTPEERDRINNTSWDKDGTPIFAEDMMLEEIMEDTQEQWAVEGLPMEETTNPPMNPTPPPPPSSALDGVPAANPTAIPTDMPPMFQGDPEADSLSTWGTKLNKNIVNDEGTTGTVAAFDRASKSDSLSMTGGSTDTGANLSQITMDSRLNTMEQSIASHHSDIGSMKNNIEEILAMMHRKFYEEDDDTDDEEEEEEEPEGDLASNEAEAEPDGAAQAAHQE
jgi:hypothetical protein